MLPNLLQPAIALKRKPPFTLTQQKLSQSTSSVSDKSEIIFNLLLKKSDIPLDNNYMSVVMLSYYINVVNIAADVR